MTHRERILSNWDRYSADLIGAITILECAKIWRKHMKTVVRAIEVGALFALKKDQEMGIPGGIWLISYSSAQDLWGDPLADIQPIYNHVEPQNGNHS